MDYAIEHNTQMRLLQHEQQRREVSVKASRDARLPRINGRVGAYAGTLHHRGDGTSVPGSYDTPSNRFNANVSLLDMGLTGVVPLYTGNRLSSQIKADEYSLLAAREDVRSAEKDLRIQVAAACLQVLYNKGERRIAQERLRVSQLLLQRARLLFQRGKRPEGDVAEAQAVVSRDQALLTAAEGDLTLSMLDLKQLLNMPDSIHLDLCEPTNAVDTLLTSHPSPLTSHLSSPTSHPAYQSANYTVLQAEQSVDIARSGYRPTLSLFGEVGTAWGSLHADGTHSGRTSLLTPWRDFGPFYYNLSGDVDWERKNLLFGIVGLQLSIPVFNAFETRARIRTAKLHLEDARTARHDALQRIRQSVSHAHQAAVTARQRYKAEVKARQSCALAYRYAQKRYDAGLSTLFDLSQSRQQWLAATENVLRMKYEYLIRKKILDIETQFITPTE